MIPKLSLSWAANSPQLSSGVLPAPGGCSWIHRTPPRYLCFLARFWATEQLWDVPLQTQPMPSCIPPSKLLLPKAPPASLGCAKPPNTRAEPPDSLRGSSSRSLIAKGGLRVVGRILGGE